MRWRRELHRLILMQRYGPYGGPTRPAGFDREDLEMAWAKGEYDDDSIPINILMAHSDCEGKIASEDCGPIADALEELLALMPERAMYDTARPATERFIRGLRLAAKRGEDVKFH
jgi:hypothetical protein